MAVLCVTFACHSQPQHKRFIISNLQLIIDTSFRCYQNPVEQVAKKVYSLSLFPVIRSVAARPLAGVVRARSHVHAFNRKLR